MPDYEWLQIYYWTTNMNRPYYSFTNMWNKYKLVCYITSVQIAAGTDFGGNHDIANSLILLGGGGNDSTANQYTK